MTAEPTLEHRVAGVATADGPEQLRALYDAWAPTYDADAAAAAFGYPSPARVAAWIAGHLPPDTDVLDAGCGDGELAAELRERGFSSVDGLDLSPAMVRRARRRRVHHDVGPADLTGRLPGAADKFGLVVAVGLLLPGQVGPAALAELARVVRPGGLVVATVAPDAFPAELPAALERLTAHGLLRRVPDPDPDLLVLEVVAASAGR